MSVTRLLSRNGEEPDKPPDSVSLAEWLDYLNNRRDLILMELRQIEPVLVKYGRLNKETPRSRMR